MNAKAPSLNEVLAANGLSTRPAGMYRKDIVSGATGAVVLKNASAHETWGWLRSTGQHGGA